MLSTSGQVDPPAANLDEEQNTQGFETNRLNGEEITSKDLVLVVGQKVAP